MTKKNLPTRRVVLAGIPALAAGQAVATEGQTQDPIVEYFRLWKEHREAWSRYDEDSAEAKHHWNEEFRFEELLCTTPPTTMEGLIAQLEFLTDPDGYGEHALGNMRDNLDRKLFENMIVGAKEMAA
ncbi:hypothetical protein [Tranquillimonas alkanivorans]|uniref:Uncharacterized protein n=1 Tax=Tranquillimonas alkanivorans TaxID=441119 RepID=A0A1I5RVH5_9RHOB|nr:hypothetical protein [Tranquillimonas alkanivorans]SFP62515.1 hypothetical protein SAMN04488047_109113 [Tranquillimonas alkanivorans]